jgi:lysophospholipid acyltransferase (LPLAT)-like uncharacterized protein
MSEVVARSTRDWRLELSVFFGQLLIRLMGATWRIRVVQDDGFRRLRAAGAPFILALWHGQMLPILYHHRGQGIAILISDHRDGEIIARIAQALGCRTVRGSTTRGGGRALLGLVRELNEGKEIAITPDGPRGPAERFAPGAIIAAQRARAPIIALLAHPRRAWRLGSWDGFLIPKPFTRITIAYSEPCFSESAAPRDAEAESGRFEALMRETAALAAHA